jgi:hypothetical protein
MDPFEASKELTEPEEKLKFAIVALDTSRFVIVAFEASRELTEAEEKLKFAIVALDTSRFVIVAFEASKELTEAEEKLIFAIVALLAVRRPILTTSPMSMDVPVTIRFDSVGAVPTETAPELDVIKRPGSVTPRNRSVSTTVFVTELEDRRPDI